MPVDQGQAGAGARGTGGVCVCHIMDEYKLQLLMGIQLSIASFTIEYAMNTLSEYNECDEYTQ